MTATLLFSVVLVRYPYRRPNDWQTLSLLLHPVITGQGIGRIGAALGIVVGVENHFSVQSEQGFFEVVLQDTLDTVGPIILNILNDGLVLRSPVV